MVRGEVETNVSEVGDVRIVCGEMEKSYGDVLPTPSSGGNSKTRRPAVGRSKSTKCMVKNIWCVTHGCAGLGGINVTEIGCRYSDAESGDFGLAEGGLNSAQNNGKLKSESLKSERLLVVRDDEVSCNQTCQSNQ